MSKHKPLVIELKIKAESVYCYFHDQAGTDLAISYGEALIELYHQEVYENSTLEPEIIGYELFHKLRKVCRFGAGVAMAGLCEEAYDYMCQKYPDYSFEEGERYTGWIFMSEPKESKDSFHAVQRSQSIPTDSFIIDFDNKSVKFGLFRITDTAGYLHALETAEFHDPDAIAPEDLPVIDYDFNNIPLDDFKNLYALLHEKYSFAHHEDGNRYIYSQRN